MKLTSIKENATSLFLYILAIYIYPYYIKTKLKYKPQLDWFTSYNRFYLRLFLRIRLAKCNPVKILTGYIRSFLYSYSRYYTSYYRKRNLDTNEFYIKQLAFMKKVDKLFPFS